MSYKTSYLAIDPDFMDVLKNFIHQKRTGKVHYFNPKEEVDDAQGQLNKLTKSSEGEFLLVGDQPVRLDQIITVLGKPGPAYEVYDAYANACLTCFDPSVNKNGSS